MKNQLRVAFIIFFSMYFMACKGKDSNQPNSYYGAWVFKTSEDSIVVMQRVAGLDSSKYSFIINPDGSFIERVNSNWCGTVISLKNYSGSWKSIGKSKLIIDVVQWGGIRTDTLQIILISNSELKYLNN